jgi:glycosyl transferase family 1
VSTDVLLVSVPSTTGWRAAVAELAAGFERVGARVRVAEAGPSPHVRTFALTDYVQARAARRAAQAALADGPVGAVVYCSMTAALLWPQPGAIWLDAVAAENRPGRHGVWQRVVERRRLRQAPLVLAMSQRALQGAPWFDGRVVVVPTPVEGSGDLSHERDVDAVAYGANPAKKRVDYVLEAWSRAQRDGERLVVAGIDGLRAGAGVEVAGRLTPDEYRALLRRARVFVAAPTREDYGIAPLEALADGCMLVTTPSPGAYPALDLARELDPRLVGDDLAAALRAALDDPVAGYAERAAALLEPFSRGAVDRALSQDVLPRLLPGWSAS